MINFDFDLQLSKKCKLNITGKAEVDAESSYDNIYNTKVWDFNVDVKEIAYAEYNELRTGLNPEIKIPNDVYILLPDGIVSEIEANIIEIYKEQEARKYE